MVSTELQLRLGDKGWSTVFTLPKAFWIIKNIFHILHFYTGQVDTSFCVLMLLIGLDPSEVKFKNAEKINEIAGSLQSDSERRSSSAAESQGMAQKYICVVYCEGGG